MISYLERLKEQRALYMQMYDEMIAEVEARIKAAQTTLVVKQEDPDRELGVGANV